MPPSPPHVALAFKIVNNGELPLYLDFGADQTELRLDLHGPGTFRLAAPGWRTALADVPPLVRLAPGATTSFPIMSLVGGTQKRPYALHWTEAGRYTVSARLRVGVSHTPPQQAGELPRHRWRQQTFAAPPLTIDVTIR